MNADESVYIVDGSGLIHRAFHAIQGLTNKQGLPTNAIYGFTSMLRRLLDEQDPAYICMALDTPVPTFRHAEYPQYKAHRPKIDEALVVQFPYMRRVCDVFRIPVFEAPGFEADDVIASLARQAVEIRLRVKILSSDKDLHQLVSDRVEMLSPNREGGFSLIDSAAIRTKYGVEPVRVIDILALSGDASDGVPGVPGIGDKGARALIQEYGSVEEALAHAEQVKRPAYRNGLMQHRDEALLSKRLVTLRTDAPVTLARAAITRQEVDRGAAVRLFDELGFTSFMREFAPPMRKSAVAIDVLAPDADCAAIVDEIRKTRVVALATISPADGDQENQLPIVALAHTPGHSLVTGLATLAASPLRSILEDSRHSTISADAKRDLLTMSEQSIELHGITMDLKLAAYLCDPGRAKTDIDSLAREYLHETYTPQADEDPFQSCGKAAEMILRLAKPIETRLSNEKLEEVFHSIEMPLTHILAKMEQAGIELDVAHLERMSRDMDRQIHALQHEIFVMAGGEFNINSPSQVAEILYERLGLKKGRKKTKGGAASTAAPELMELAREHDLPQRILDYRAAQKLKSTYVDTLPTMIHPKTGRLHTTFHQTVAATGRLSSSDPNLQNIPIRTLEGRRIREAFKAKSGSQLLSADYSQIELRVLAHLSEDEGLLATFSRGEDIHVQTAEAVFGPFSLMPSDEKRRRSKMINYALLYGKTAFTLAKDLGVSQKEAQAIIAQYFARFPRVRQYLDGCVEEARATGEVRTLFGRLRRLPDISSSNFALRSEAERQAVNTPIQGTAADLIKKAMIALDQDLIRHRLNARLILQIHDELVLEVPDAEAEDTLILVKQVMEQAAPLLVPLVVDAHLGRNWSEAH